MKGSPEPKYLDRLCSVAIFKVAVMFCSAHFYARISPATSFENIHVRQACLADLLVHGNVQIRPVCFLMSVQYSNTLPSLDA